MYPDCTSSMHFEVLKKNHRTNKAANSVFIGQRFFITWYHLACRSFYNYCWIIIRNSIFNCLLTLFTIYWFEIISYMFNMFISWRCWFCNFTVNSLFNLSLNTLKIFMNSVFSIKYVGLYKKIHKFKIIWFFFFENIFSPWISFLQTVLDFFEIALHVSSIISMLLFYKINR